MSANCRCVCVAGRPLRVVGSLAGGSGRGDGGARMAREANPSAQPYSSTPHLGQPRPRPADSGRANAKHRKKNAFHVRPLGYDSVNQDLTHRKAARITCDNARAMNEVSHFDQLLQAAIAQPEPQRLLFVFAAAGLPEDATASQRQRHAAGAGGTLTPLMCVDKAPAELSGFEALIAESRKAGPPWQVVFAAGLAGRDSQPPGAAQVEQALQAMVERVRGGVIDGLLALDPSGAPLSFA